MATSYSHGVVERLSPGRRWGERQPAEKKALGNDARAAAADLPA